MEKSIEFIIGAKLPWVYKAVIATYGYSTGGSPKERRESKVTKKQSMLMFYHLWEHGLSICTEERWSLYNCCKEDPGLVGIPFQ